MSWPRGSLFTALLVLSIPLASADTITVNTTTDDYADNSLCSLREAVEYFNLDKPVSGFQGCKTDSSSGADTVSVPANSAAYQINADTLGGTERDAIFIRRNLTITGGGMRGDEKTWIQVNGPHRAFIISSVRTIAPPACATSGNCKSTSTAPDLDATSNSNGNYLITVDTPTFTGQVPVPVGSSNVQVTLYDKATVAGPDAEPVMIGTALADNASGNWTIVSTALAEGLHNVTYTVTVDDNDEGEHSAATQFAVQAADDPALIVSLSQMEIQGCDGTDCANAINTAVTPLSSTSANGLVYTYPLTIIQGKGGIIYSNETLDMAGVTIHGGVASLQGGAVYSAADAVVGLSGSKFNANRAPDGAAIYAEKNAVFISQSLITDNTPTTGAVISMASDTLPAAITEASIIEVSTISGNQGLALSLRKGAVVSASTIVNNAVGGVHFNNAVVSVYNTILAGNPDAATTSATDCIQSANVDFAFSLGLVGGGCGATSAPAVLTLLRNNDVSFPREKLFASLDAAGKCQGYQSTSAATAAFQGMGLLCPLAERSDDDVTAYHMPRLLPVYTAASDSPIVSKGADGSTTTQCSSTDQRSKPRRSICDIGAVELQPVNEAVISGDAITYGQTYSEALDSELGDEELFVPTAITGAGSCPAFALTANEDKMKPGCPWITTAPTKGTVVFNPDGTYTYRPSSRFHGFDRFSFRVVTNLSKLNSTFDSQSRIVNAQVIVEPSHGLTGYTTSGSADLWLLLALAGLGGAAARAGRRGQK